jgi:hypothetical protein
MNDGMKIILERMKTHPEEFKDDNKPFAYDGKWIGLVSEYENNLPEEDMKAFKEAIDVMRQEEFTAKVMEELLDPKEEQLELDLNIRRTPPRMQQAGQTHVQSSVAPSLEQTLARLEEIKKEYDPKKYKTLFGKLFNYS